MGIILLLHPSTYNCNSISCSGDLLCGKANPVCAVNWWCYYNPFRGLTLYFNNPVFIYMKPTIVNVIFAGTLIISKIFFNKNFLKFFLQTAFQLNETGWDKLNFRWAYFFIFLALINEIVWRTQPETTWVNFKVWGILPITFIFTVFQLPLIRRYKI